MRQYDRDMRGYFTSDKNIDYLHLSNEFQLVSRYKIIDGANSLLLKTLISINRQDIRGESMAVFV